MHFALEALQAHHGDSLLLHWGTVAAPRVMLVDGGPSPTYADTLRDRLLTLAAERSGGALDIDLLMVSHIDEDHIQGVQSLLRDLARGNLSDVQVRRLWFNSFDDLTDLDAGFVSLSDRRPSPAQLRRRLGPGSAPIALSVPQGRSVTKLAGELGLNGNPPFNGLVMRRRTPRKVAFDQLRVTVIAPDKTRIDALRAQWAAAASDGAALAYVDDSVPNLSSIVVIAEAAEKTMLLTGDARGDDILAGLRTAGLLRHGPARFDLLKLPHHGSDRNVETEFFRQVVADHYVISGDGSNNNPELSTLQMLTEARAGAAFTIHFTNREARLEQWFKRNKQPGDRYKVVYRRKDRPSIRVQLATE